MARTSNKLPADLLKSVSRSFYLTLRVLPTKIRFPIGLAYLLARITDTIADTGLIPVEKKLQALQALRERILGLTEAPLDFGELALQQAAPAERELLEKCEASLALLQKLTPADLHLVRNVLSMITSGQELDLQRFTRASRERIVALSTDRELDDYTYRVAGCVGEFWTKICRLHLFPRAVLDDTFLLESGVRFGKGLQLVNILRDLPADLRHGRCYLPTESLSVAGLKPEDLLQPANEPRLRRLYGTYLDRAQAHLLAGWAYTNAIPQWNVRLRLACSWPILIGMETLKLLRSGNALDPQQHIKVSRRQVRLLMLRSVLMYPWGKAWRNLVPSTAGLSGKAVASEAVLP